MIGGLCPKSEVKSGSLSLIVDGYLGFVNGYLKSWLFWGM